ncbi:hypothetical protein LCGC14_2050230 [marine sediment metagenome]|uniref:Radical SAM core domain-containing protein n=1 Tax=marine sediment metagenome TaxID=412755 RepID=A0A0F9EPC9_9ZZZZ
MIPKLALVEVFAAPQGEGYNAGRSAVFVRLAGCPLACEFAPGVVCDTPYQQANLKVTLDTLFNDIIPALLPPVTKGLCIDEAPMLIITGGEPTAAPLFDDLMRRAYDSLYYVAVETNGTNYRIGLEYADWVSVSPKVGVPQTSSAAGHNQNPKLPTLNLKVCNLLSRPGDVGGEYRYVIVGHPMEMPPYYPAIAHYVSPLVRSDGSGLEWKDGFPGFAPNAVRRCLEIIKEDPRWRISVQTHKVLGVR